MKKMIMEKAQTPPLYFYESTLCNEAGTMTVDAFLKPMWYLMNKVSMK